MPPRRDAWRGSRLACRTASSQNDAARELDSRVRARLVRTVPMTIRTAAPAHRPGKPLTPQAERRRDQSLEAALAVMSRKGFDRTSIADIAGRARVARATVYQHFADKRDVLVALANRVTFRVI